MKLDIGVKPAKVYCFFTTVSPIMASQAKITSFYRTTKNSNTVAAAKRRKAVIEVEETDTKITVATTTVKPEKETEATVNVVKAEQKLEPPSVIVSSSNIFTNGKVVKSVDKKRTVKKTKKSSKVIENPHPKITIKSAPKLVKDVESAEKIKEELTSFEDNHEFNPIDVATTPKHPTDNTASTRKRKMECGGEAVSLPQSPKQPEEKTGIRTPNKVRKRLDMGAGSTSLPQPVKEILSHTGSTHSPLKQVQFLCLGTLSPRKLGMDSPSKCTNSSNLNVKHFTPKQLEKRIGEVDRTNIRSPAVKSLASVLDQVPTPAPKVNPIPTVAY